MKRTMKTFELFWGPTGRAFALVSATTVLAAKRKAPRPWGRYQGEIYAKEVKA
jgi:hypothetical protein